MFVLNFNRFFFIALILISSCGRLRVDDTVAYPLVTISTSPTPALEDIRNFAQLGDLIYAAAGSGGILAYRIVGDVMEPVLNLSLTNLYSEELEQIYVRTIEILKTDTKTNLIFSYDTLYGGGVGVAEISAFSTKPLGSLQTDPNLRIKYTSTTYNPLGIYHVLVASENVGMISYDLSFISNSYFEIPEIASLVDYVAALDIERPAQNFLSLASPESMRITNISQITNLEVLVQLALDDPSLFSSVISNIPFISEQQKSQIQNILSVTNQPFVSNVVDMARDRVGQDAIDKVLENPKSFESLLNSSALSPSVSDILAQVGDDDVYGADQVLSNITPDLIAQAQQIVEEREDIDVPIDVQNALSLSGLQQIVQNTTRPTTNTTLSQNEVRKTETLFEESILSNLNLAGDIDTSLVHNKNYNPFINRRAVGNARAEIQKTVSAFDRRFYVEENEELKNRILALRGEELQNIFTSLFTQTDSAMALIPMFENAGINVRELYQHWINEDYDAIIKDVDVSVFAELLRQLPRYQVQTVFQATQTNLALSTISSIHSDLNTFYIASGAEGILVVDRTSWRVIDSIKNPFSEVVMIKPYKIFGQDIYVVSDKLEGLTLYKKNRDRSIGKQLSRISLIGETLYTYPYEDVLWVADGSNGVLAVRVNRDFSLTIEAEFYQKSGVAYYIGTARRREALVSYGADGLKRLRITNADIVGTSTMLDQEVTQHNYGDFIDNVLLWSHNSTFAQFLRRLFLS